MISSQTCPSLPISEDGAIVPFQDRVDNLPGAFVVDVDLLGLWPEDDVEGEFLRWFIASAIGRVLHADAPTNRVHVHSLEKRNR